MIRAPTSGMRCSGTTSDVLAEARVEAPGDVAHQLEVLALVLADRHLVRRGRRARRRPAAPGRRAAPAETSSRWATDLSRNWCMRLSSPTAVTDDSSQRSSVCSGHVALAEEDAALGFQARREQDRRRVVDALAQLRRVVGHGDRVQVDDAVDRRIAAVLTLDVLADRADVVAQVLAPGGLDAGEDAHGPTPYPAQRKAGAPLRQALEHLGGEWCSRAPERAPAFKPAWGANGRAARSSRRTPLCPAARRFNRTCHAAARNG